MHFFPSMRYRGVLVSASDWVLVPLSVVLLSPSGGWVGCRQFSLGSDVLTRPMISLCAFYMALIASSNSVAHMVSVGVFDLLLLLSFVVGVKSPPLFVFVSLTMLISFLSFSCVFFLVMAVSRLSVLLISLVVIVVILGELLPQG